MKLQADYKGWYFRESPAEYIRMARGSKETNIEQNGTNLRGDVREA
jgi:hypothetical protein